MPVSIPHDTLNAVLERLRRGASALIAESKALGFTHNGPLRTALRELLGAEGYDQLMAGKRPTMAPRVPGAPAGAPVVPLPDDSAVPTINAADVRWVVDQKTHDHLVKQCHDLTARLQAESISEEHLSPVVARMLRTSLTDTLRSLEKRVHVKRKGAWSTEAIFTPRIIEIVKGKDDEGKKMMWRELVASVSVAPDGTRYVEAKYNEHADLIMLRPSGALRLRLYESSLAARKQRAESAEIERGEEARKTRSSARATAEKVTAAIVEDKKPEVAVLTKKGRTKKAAPITAKKSSTKPKTRSTN